MSPPASPSGLPAERTALAWTRTSLAVLANGAVLLLGDVSQQRAAVGLAAVGLCVVVALGTFAIGQHRQRRLTNDPLPQRLTPVREVYLVAAAVLTLIVVSVVSLPF